MGTFSQNTNASTSTSIALEWNFESDVNGIIQSMTITQTAPSGTQTTQTFSTVTISGATIFSGLAPDTAYSYVLTAPWEDDNGDLNVESLECAGTTKAKAAAGASGAGGGGSAGSQVPIPPDPIINLTASWNAPEYTEITVNWQVGLDTTNTRAEAAGAGTYISDWSAELSQPSNKNPASATFSGVKPSSYSITATAANISLTNTTSKTIALAAPPLPGAITGLNAAWKKGYLAVELTWAQGQGTPTTSFELQRYAGEFSASATPQATVPVVPPSSPFTDTPTNLSLSSQYQYQLIATNAFGQQSEVSNVLSPPQAPSSPTNVVAKWTIEYTQVSVTWDPSDQADNYEVVLLQTDSFDVLTQLEDHVGVTSTSFQDQLAGQLSTDYQYRIIAHNRFGSNSSLSNFLMVSGPPSPPVTFGPSPGVPPPKKISPKAP
jgi:hypothetical protein